MSAITQSFLDSFSELETLVSNAANQSKPGSVIKNFNSLCDKKPFYRQYKDDMQKLANLLK